MLDFKSFELN